MKQTAARNHGFSLGELMAVLALMAALVGLVIPAFLNYLPRMRLQTTSRQIASDVVAARLLALERRTMASLTYDADSHSYMVQPLGRVRPLPEGISVSSFPPVVFNSRGLLNQQQPVEVSLDGGCGTSRLSVSLGGRVKVELE